MTLDAAFSLQLENEARTVHLWAWQYTGRMGQRPKCDLPPDPVVEAYKKDVDRTLLREHLRLTPQQRLETLVAFMRSVDRLQTARQRRP